MKECKLITYMIINICIEKYFMIQHLLPSLVAILRNFRLKQLTPDHHLHAFVTDSEIFNKLLIRKCTMIKYDLPWKIYCLAK